MMFLTLFVDLGLWVLATGEIAARRATESELVRRIVSAQAALAVIVYALLCLVVFLVPLEPTLRRLLLGFGVSLFGMPFLLPWVFQGRSRMAPVALLQVLRQTVFVVTVLILVRTPADLLRLPWAEVLAVGAAALGYVLILQRSGEAVTMSVRAACDAPLLREALPIGGSQLVWACRMYLPIMLLATFAGQSGIGFFGAAHRIVMVGQTLLSVYFTALFPALSQASFQSGDPLALLLQRSVRWVLWPMLLLAAATTLGAPFVMRLVFGGQFTSPEASTTLAVLIWLLPVLAWRRHDRSALIALSRQGEELCCSLFALALLVLLTIHLGGRYGVVGGGWAMLVAGIGG